VTFSDEELPAVGEASHAVTRDAHDAGVWVLAGTVTDGPESKAYIGGSRSSTCPHARSLEWAARFAVACR
jgi:hypothetical protein